MSLADIDALRRDFTGEVILPGDEGYEQARKTYAAVGSPAVVLRPAGVDDVITAVRFGAASGRTVSVRSGGHHMAGFGTNTDGVVIDLSKLDKVELAGDRVVRVGPGATWGEVAKFLQDHGLAISSGDTKSVGVGGLTLGGGIGWLVRQVGSAVDQLLAATVVTADGAVHRASATENPDLFWALRGGGGNVGVVTLLEFSAVELGRVHAGAIDYGLDELGQVLRGWREHMRTAPEQLNSSVTIMPSFGPDFPAMAQVLVCYAGADAEAAEAAIAPLRSLGTALREDVQEKDYFDVLDDPQSPEGVRSVVKSLFADDFGDALIDAIVAAFGTENPPVLQVRALGGALARVPSDATAMAHRDAEVMMFSGTFVAPDASQADVDAALGTWRTLAAHGTGQYANFLSDVTEQDVALLYPSETHARLARIKKTYDPANLFDQNANVKPAS
ncbi:FAD-binding oxidoreductase [Actinokineospora sp. 24-640]